MPDLIQILFKIILLEFVNTILTIQYIIKI